MRTERGFVESTTATYTVDPGGELTIDADFGSVRIETATTDKVEIFVEKQRKEGTADEARRAFEDVEVTTEQQGNDVHLRVDHSRWLGRNGMSIEMTVQVPYTYDLDIETAGGSIVIADLDGEIRAKTAGGSIRIGATQGDVNARTLGGSIRIGPTEGGVSAKTLGGSIDIGDANGDVSAQTMGGSIRVGRTEGDLTAYTMGGNITVEAVSGKASAKTLGGKVRVGST
ncbi:MAG: DUF4097 domain-containing protein [Gemmatimonadetes bacterium]|nr:DUF4097 domain-containing protein [Gemmatimonadota bacterium]MYA76554.1 DUF4097 domain-containing protein [Gemmatimonadota bacterium]MYG17801.1 DUF4097 domain-containing protein [Gemmatimonadota bacterium]MYH18358.1 DUF4097 domain-containing protein [Gemmatimonadota bacterium]MYK97368.1 DUF4097 domain-containing protein [Gemmatimonadota bacterium]